jgi:proteasome lid subunit RPN8/RPN11
MVVKKGVWIVNKNMRYSDGVVKIKMSKEEWEKSVWAAGNRKTEVGFMGRIVERGEEKEWLIDKLGVLSQECTSVTTEMDEDGLAKWVFEGNKEGLAAWQLLRVWVHTHPGMGTGPSGVDWATFEEMFKDSDWGVMLIVNEKGEYSCNVWWNKWGGVVLKGEILLVNVCDKTEEWKKEIEENVKSKAAIVRNLTQVGGVQNGWNQYGVYDRWGYDEYADVGIDQKGGIIEEGKKIVVGEGIVVIYMDGDLEEDVTEKAVIKGMTKVQMLKRLGEKRKIQSIVDELFGVWRRARKIENMKLVRTSDEEDMMMELDEGIRKGVLPILDEGDQYGEKALMKWLVLGGSVKLREKGFCLTEDDVIGLFEMSGSLMFDKKKDGYDDKDVDEWSNTMWEETYLTSGIETLVERMIEVIDKEERKETV